MPKIHLTDTVVQRDCVAIDDKTTWYSDTETTGLQLCVTPAGAKTWYLNRWDPKAGKTRRVKIGPFAPKGTHTRWAREQAQKKTVDLIEGRVQTRVEREQVEASVQRLPTFREALEQMIELRSNPNRKEKSGKRSMSPTTVRDYRGSFDKHLARWADIAVDELPVLEISAHLDAMQNDKPQAALRASAVASSAINFISKRANIALRVPSLSDPTRARSRADEDGDIDMSVPLSSRWDDIMMVDNEHKRLCLQLTAYTGLRGRPLRALTWDRVYQVDVDSVRVWAINLDQPVKKSPEDREIVLGDDAGRIIERLREIAVAGCDWVFPSRRVCGTVRGHIDAIDKFGDTTVNVLRHYWMVNARTHVELATVKWLALHSMKASGFGMVGHYGVPERAEQYRAGNVVASKVNLEIGRAGSRNVVDLRSVAS